MMKTRAAQRIAHERAHGWNAFGLILVLVAAGGILLAIASSWAGDPMNGGWWAMAWIAAAPAYYAQGRLRGRLGGDATSLGLAVSVGVAGLLAVPFTVSSLEAMSVAAALVTAPFLALFLLLARKFVQRAAAGRA